MSRRGMLECTKCTFVIGIAVFLADFFPPAQVRQTKICDLQDKSTIDDTVGTFECAVRFNITAVEIAHTLVRYTPESGIRQQTQLPVAVQFQLLDMPYLRLVSNR